MKLLNGLLPLAVALCASANASIVAVVDSGLDVNHKDLSSKVWQSSTGENGWNFVDNNSTLIDSRKFGIFNDDIAKFFEIQYYIYLLNNNLGTVPEELMTWYNDVLFKGGEINQDIYNDGAFWGTFSHGTHVSGIVAKNNDDVELVGVKLIGQPAKLNLLSLNAQAVEPQVNGYYALTEEEKDNLKAQLDEIASMQSARMREINGYVANTGARVSNASFGTGYPQTYGWLKSVLRGVPSSDVRELAVYFQEQLVKLGTPHYANANDVLFVVAAGNDGSNNDVFPDSPANIESDNVITVAATFERNELAEFSNYGVNHVHVAAPGVGIYSTAPGDNYVYMNGTSQAAPYVSRVASLVVDANENLTSGEVKQIIMQTVDKKAWLKNRVTSGGIVNDNRAVYAARLTANGVGLNKAIARANDEIKDMPEAVVEKSHKKARRMMVRVLPTVMPNPIQFM